MQGHISGRDSWNGYNRTTNSLARREASTFICRAEALASEMPVGCCNQKHQLRDWAILLTFPLGVLAHLGLSRAYALRGDTAKARGAYQDFLTLWEGRQSRHPHPAAGQGRVR